MTDKYCLTFAGAVGSSKTPISHVLSCTYNLPIFNNDAIRTEVTEDLLEFNEEEHIKRRDERIEKVLRSEYSFICDASVDRRWEVYKKALSEHGYDWFIISMDLSKEFLIKIHEAKRYLHKAKGYSESLKRLEQVILDHDKFLEEFNGDVSLHITDADFSNRIALSTNAFGNWLNALK